MPMSNGNYVAPTWVDNAPPALDAAELQAMCDTIVQNQGDAAALQAAVQALTTTVGGKAQVVTGSYVGSGTYGSSNKTIISTASGLKAVIIHLSDDDYPYGQFVWLYGAEYGMSYITTNAVCTITWSSSSVSWYSTTAGFQLNQSGKTYKYLLIY